MDIFSDVQTGDVDLTNVNAYETLVGTDKKYKDNESLAKAALFKDAHILKIERENAELREKTQAAKTMEEIKTQILQGLKPQEQPVTPAAPTPVEQNKSPLDIEALITQTLESREAQKRVQTNREVVSQTMTEKFGADAQIVLNQKAKELGVSLDYLAKVANDSPTAFFKLIDVSTQKTQAPAAPAPRNQVQVQTGSNVRDAAYYANLKRSNPTAYFSQEVRAQQMKDALALGEAYFN